MRDDSVRMRDAHTANDDMIAGVVFPSADDPVYIADGDADQLIYIHRGGGTLRACSASRSAGSPARAPAPAAR